MTMLVPWLGQELATALSKPTGEKPTQLDLVAPSCIDSEPSAGGGQELATTLSLPTGEKYMEPASAAKMQHGLSGSHGCPSAHTGLRSLGALLGGAACPLDHAFQVFLGGAACPHDHAFQVLLGGEACLLKLWQDRSKA